MPFHNKNCISLLGLFFVQSAFGKLQEGKKMSQAVDLILAKPGMNRMKSRSIFVCEGMICKLLCCIKIAFALNLSG